MFAFLYLSACREEGGNKVVADDCEQRLLLVEVLSNLTLVCVLQYFFGGGLEGGNTFLIRPIREKRCIQINLS